MKATGMIRRIDELGRIVIPKEIRKTYKLKEGDLIEIFASNENLILKKFSPLKNLNKIAKNYTEILSQVLECNVLFCDRTSYLACSGKNDFDYVGEEISREVSSYIEQRKSVILNKTEGAYTIPLKNGGLSDFSAQIIVPFISEGDISGGLVMFSNDVKRKFDSAEVKSAKITAMLIDKELS